jgi:hypothetical protein
MMGLKDINAKNAYVTAVHKAEVLATHEQVPHYVVKQDGVLQITTTKPDNVESIKYTAMPAAAEVA